MFLAIDIGNTDVVIGFFKKDNIIKTLRIPSKLKSFKEIKSRAKLSLSEVEIKTGDIKGIGISSVVPDLTVVYHNISEKLFHRKPLIINSELQLGININYDNPKSLGSDRLCNAIAGYKKYGGPLIIIDFGTATTFDVVSSDGDFLGGVIAPGIKTSAIALHKQTAKLPIVELKLPRNIICTNTETSIQAGILFGAIDSVKGIINRIQNELNSIETKKAKIIATGGLAELIAQHSDFIQHIEPTLVLEGIKYIYESIKKK